MRGDLAVPSDGRPGETTAPPTGRRRRDDRASPAPRDHEARLATGRPLSEALHRSAVRLTPAQSDVLARLLLSRRLVELLGLRNGAVAATFRGAGYVAWRAFITSDGRLLENSDASEPDASGDAEGPFTIVRDSAGLHLGTILPPRPGRDLTERSRDE